MEQRCLFEEPEFASTSERWLKLPVDARREIVTMLVGLLVRSELVVSDEHPVLNEENKS